MHLNKPLTDSKTAVSIRQAPYLTTDDPMLGRWYSKYTHRPVVGTEEWIEPVDDDEPTYSVIIVDVNTRYTESSIESVLNQSIPADNVILVTKRKKLERFEEMGVTPVSTQNLAAGMNAACQIIDSPMIAVIESEASVASNFAAMTIWETDGGLVVPYVYKKNNKRTTQPTYPIAYVFHKRVWEAVGGFRNWMGENCTASFCEMATEIFGRTSVNTTVSYEERRRGQKYDLPSYPTLTQARPDTKPICGCVVVVPAGGSLAQLQMTLDYLRHQDEFIDVCVVNDSGVAIPDFVKSGYAFATFIQSTEGSIRRAGIGRAFNRGMSNVEGDHIYLMMSGDVTTGSDTVRVHLRESRARNAATYANSPVIGMEVEWPTFDCDLAHRQPSPVGQYIWCTTCVMVPRNGVEFNSMLSNNALWLYHLNMARSGTCYIKIDSPMSALAHQPEFLPEQPSLRAAQVKQVSERLEPIKPMKWECCGNRKLSKQGDSVMSADLVNVQYMPKKNGSHTYRGKATKTGYPMMMRGYARPVHPDDIKADLDSFRWPPAEGILEGDRITLVDGQLVVPSDEKFKLEEVTGISKVSAKKLRANGVEGVSELVGISDEELVELGVAKSQVSKVVAFLKEHYAEEYEDDDEVVDVSAGDNELSGDYETGEGAE